MSKGLIIASILFSTAIIVFILVLLRKKKVNIKYSIIWLILFLVLLISTLVPGFLNLLTHSFGFKTPSNMVFSLIMAALVVITIALTVIVSEQDRKIRLLLQELSLLKRKNDKK